MNPQWVDVDWDGRCVRIEHVWLNRDAPDARAAPLLVFLHEGLGSLAMWRDFPAALCQAAGVRGLVYSRPGYGRSTPRAAGEAWDVDFMHAQAHALLPALLAALDVDTRRDPPWFYGHSDGGSIALLYAARFAGQVAGLIVAAPHVMVEDISVASIEQARVAYQSTDLRQRLARYHDDPDSAFRGWNDVWLKPEFRHWNIIDGLAPITCPILALQGLDDEYGTLEQIRSIARALPQTRLLELPDCGHSPHRDQRQAVIQACTGFIQSNSPHGTQLSPQGDR